MKTHGASASMLAEVTALEPRTMQRYLKDDNERMLWPLLPKILEAYPRLSRQWLYFGEGPMTIGLGIPLDQEVPLDEIRHAVLAMAEDAGGTDARFLRFVAGLNYDAPTTQANPTRPQAEPQNQHMSITSLPVPVVGLAACGIDGIEQIMPYAVTASPITMGPRAVAVVASGESMVPAGIASGHMCFCDPDQQALPGEAVFLRRIDDKGTLKLFLGPGQKEGYTAFKGWLPAKDNTGQPKPFDLQVANEQIDYIAPVIFVRRRL